MLFENAPIIRYLNSVPVPFLDYFKSRFVYQSNDKHVKNTQLKVTDYRYKVKEDSLFSKIGQRTWSHLSLTNQESSNLKASIERPNVKKLKKTVLKIVLEYSYYKEDTNILIYYILDLMSCYYWEHVVNPTSSVHSQTSYMPAHVNYVCAVQKLISAWNREQKTENGCTQSGKCSVKTNITKIRETCCELFTSENLERGEFYFAIHKFCTQKFTCNLLVFYARYQKFRSKFDFLKKTIKLKGMNF